MTSKFWHWPDRNIGKRESRQLREEHNALANSHDELLTLLTTAMHAWEQQFDHSEDLDDPSINGGDLIEWFAEWRESVKGPLARAKTTP